MTTEEIENLTNNLAEEYERFKDELTVKNYIKRVIEITNLHWQEKTRWIPVEERLPPRGTKTRQVFVKNKNKHHLNWMIVSCFDDAYIDDIEFIKGEFTHWKEIE